MSIPTNKTKSATTYSFALALTEPLDKKNTHDQLYDALAQVGGDWYQPAVGEPRRVQYAKKAGFLICRSTHKPTAAIALEETIEVSNGDILNVELRLPASSRTPPGHPRGKNKMEPLKEEDKIPYFSQLLSKHGMGVLSMTQKHSFDNNIQFKGASARVVIHTCDVVATVKVMDVEAFINAYQLGVGRYKTYGCGMLNITKIEG